MQALEKLSNYGSSFQTKVIFSLLHNKDLLLTIHDIVDPEYFDNPAHKWIVEEVLRYFYKYHTAPTLDSFSVEVKKIDNEILKISIIEQLRIIYHVTENDSKYVEQGFVSFCRNQQLKKALFSSINLLTDGKYDEIRNMIDAALKAGMDKNIGHEYIKDIETRYRVDERKVIPTGWKVFDDLLSGGLGGGDFGLIFGSPGGGKSWSLVSIGANALLNGYNVIHYTLELSQNYVGKRYDAHISGIAVNEVHNNRQEIEKIIKDVKGNLIIKEYSPGKASMNTIEAHIKKCIDLGFPPDLIIIDYVDLLRSKRKGGDRKEEIDDNYTATKALAKDMNLPVWSVSQVNRAGARDEVIEGDKAAGSYDKMMVTDFAASLSRRRIDKVNGVGRFHIMKNRYGMDGMTYLAEIDIKVGKIIISDKDFEEGADSIDLSRPPTTPSGPINRTLFNNSEKEYLRDKFFQLNK